jgi:hypothetical protein
MAEEAAAAAEVGKALASMAADAQAEQPAEASS